MRQPWINKVFFFFFFFFYIVNPLFTKHGVKMAAEDSWPCFLFFSYFFFSS